MLGAVGGGGWWWWKDSHASLLIVSSCVSKQACKSGLCCSVIDVVKWFKVFDLTDSDMMILILVLTEVWTMFTDYHRVKRENEKQKQTAA